MSGEQPKAENSPVAERHTVHAARAVIIHLFNFIIMGKFRPEYLLQKLATAGREMRDAQADYFRTKSAIMLTYAKRKEVAFDRLVLVCLADLAHDENGGYPVDVAAEVLGEGEGVPIAQGQDDSNTRAGVVL